MRTINTLTVMYDEREDRLHLAARYTDGVEQGLWLTQRLANQLVKVLARHVREQTSRAARQAASRPGAHPVPVPTDDGLPPREAAAPAPAAAAPQEVVPVELDGGSPHGLVHTINIVRHESGLIHLIFHWSNEDAAMLPLDAAALVRVVDILRLRYRSAGWPIEGEWAAPPRTQMDFDSAVPPNTTIH